MIYLVQFRYLAQQPIVHIHYLVDHWLLCYIYIIILSCQNIVERYYICIPTRIYYLLITILCVFRLLLPLLSIVIHFHSSSFWMYTVSYYTSPCTSLFRARCIKKTQNDIYCLRNLLFQIREHNMEHRFPCVFGSYICGIAPPYILLCPFNRNSSSYSIYKWVQKSYDIFVFNATWYIAVCMGNVIIACTNECAWKW